MEHGYGSMRDLDETPGVAPGMFQADSGQRRGATPSYSATQGGNQSTGVMSSSVGMRSSSNTAPGTFGARVAPSSGNSIGSGTVRGEEGPMPTATAAPARTSRRTGTASPSSGSDLGRANALIKRQGPGVATTAPYSPNMVTPRTTGNSGPMAPGANSLSMVATTRGAPTRANMIKSGNLTPKTVPVMAAPAARSPHTRPNLPGAADSEGFAGSNSTTQHGFGRSNCKF